MEITSLYFGVLSLFAIFAYYMLNAKFRIPLLVVLSCAFIASYSVMLLIYILIYTCINYSFGHLIFKTRPRKVWFILGLTFNLLQLVLLRYSTFALDPVFAAFGSNFQISSLSSIIIPLGISFFTLQAIGYLINIKMGWEKPEPLLIDFALYILFFPKFLSGPVERSNHFLPQLKTARSFNTERVASGLKIMLFGLFKKIAIANQIAPLLSAVYSNVPSADGSDLWLILILQPMYIYFDFSGYTDIAIGLSKTFGINLLPNFNRPFFSENVTTFWKRFHISLSSWFNDYVFKQTSFKLRKWGIYASIFSLFLTWTLFGIWHGAGWNFMVLGLVQGLAMIYEFFTKKWRQLLFSKLPVRVRIWIGRGLTYCFYACSLVFFFSPNPQSAFDFISG